MNEDHLIQLAKELSIPVMQIAATAKLLEDGATVPFIARYRKEATGTLDEVAITAIRDGLERLKALDDRRESIKKSLSERNLLTDELSAAIAAAETLAKLEDIYQPFKPKRRTRATVAREKGLEGLAAPDCEDSVRWRGFRAFAPIKVVAVFCAFLLFAGEYF